MTGAGSTINNTTVFAESTAGQIFLINGGTLAGSGSQHQRLHGTYFFSNATVNAIGTGNQITANAIGFGNLTFNTPSLTDTLTVSSLLGGTSTVTGTVTKNGPGTVNLTSSAANVSSYTGATTINAGTLELSSASTTNPFVSPVTINPGGTFQLNATAPSQQVATTTAILTLKGGTLSYTTPTNAYWVWEGPVVVAARQPSSISTRSGTFATNTGGLYFDGAFTGSAPDLPSTPPAPPDSDWVSAVPTTFIAARSTVNGFASTVPGSGSGIGRWRCQQHAPNANLHDQRHAGRWENNANGMGWGWQRQ